MKSALSTDGTGSGAATGAGVFTPLASAGSNPPPAAGSAMNRLLVFVVGPSRAGKSTFAAALAEALGGHVVETGRVVIESYRQLTGCIITEEQKDTYRSDLQAIGDLMTSRCKSRLVEITLADPEIQTCTAPLIICGVRRREELFESSELAAANGYRVWVIYIRRPGVEDLHTTIATMADADLVVENYSGPDHLRHMALKIAVENLPVMGVER